MTKTKRAVRGDGGHRTALVLQGGAALGAYEAGVLKALLAAGRPLEIVTGCSIGALMAAIVVGSRGDPAATLDELWQRLAVATNPFLPNLLARSLPLQALLPLGASAGEGDLYRINPLYFAMPPLATYLYETTPLLAALEKWIDFRKLNAAPTELIVTAVEVKSGRLVEFSNRRGKLTAKHIMASASLPPVFAPVLIDGNAYWDGGLISNTPLRPAINAIEAHNRHRRAERWELVVVDLLSPEERLPADLNDVMQRLFELVFLGKFQHDLKLYQWMNAELDLMIEVDRALPKSSPVRRHPAYRKLSQHRRVDALTVVRTANARELGGPADFSREAIGQRLALGEADGRRVFVPPEPKAGDRAARAGAKSRR